MRRPPSYPGVPCVCAHSGSKMRAGSQGIRWTRSVSNGSWPVVFSEVLSARRLLEEDSIFRDSFLESLDEQRRRIGQMKQ